MAELIQGLFDGTVNPVNLPENLFAAIVKNLDQAVSNGFRSVAGNIHFGGPDYQLLQQLRENIYLFSAAKTFQQTLEMSHALIDPATGDIRSFKDFEDKAQQIFDKYNRNWLRSEYETAQLQAGNAAKWQDIEAKKDVLPYLRYISVQDRRVCEICNPLNNITLPVEDPFWKRYSPSNHFNCRCILEQLDQVEGFNASSDKRSVDKAKKDSKVPVEFQYNPGQLKEIFPTEGRSKHPYFIVPKEYEAFARNNFNLPILREEGTFKVRSRKENKELAKNIIVNGMGIGVKRMSVSADLNDADFTQMVDYLQKLMNEYQPSSTWSKTSNINLEFVSRGNILGCVTSSRDGRYLAGINFGHIGENYVYNGDPLSRLFSRCDDENRILGTLTHEFGHVLSVRSQAFSGDSHIQEFWRKLYDIKTDYMAETLKNYRTRNLRALDQLSLGDYADLNMSEFMAEGFKEYKLCKSPSKFAKKIGELIDQYFKRKS